MWAKQANSGSVGLNEQDGRARTFNVPEKPLLKQYGDSTSVDFEKHPVWALCHCIDYDQPWYEDTDEETVRPWDGPMPWDPGLGMALVRATFTLADGRQFAGFITPQESDEPLDLGTMQPQVFLPSGKCGGFWHGMVKNVENDKRIYAELGNVPEAIFPITFAAARELAKGQVTGAIAGFLWMPNNKVLVYS